MHDSQDQTKFTQEEPLFEQPDSPELVVGEAQKTTKSANRLILIGGGLLVVLMLLVIVVAALSQRPAKTSQVVASPSPSPVVLDETELARRVTQLKSDLTSADPTKQDLIFPPVNMDIRLDKKVR